MRHMLISNRVCLTVCTHAVPQIVAYCSPMGSDSVGLLLESDLHGLSSVSISAALTRQAEVCLKNFWAMALSMNCPLFMKRYCWQLRHHLLLASIHLERRSQS